MTNILNSLMSGGYEPDESDLDWQPEDDIFDLEPSEAADIDQEYFYNPEEEDRRKEWLENYAAEAMGVDPDELPYYPFIKQDPAQFAKQVIGIDLDGDYKPDI